MFGVRSWWILLGVVASVAAFGCGGDEAARGGGGGQAPSGGASTGGGATGGSAAGGSAAGGSAGSSSSGATGVGEGGGIAQGYPQDQGIEAHPDVIFADDFESYADASELWDRWDNTFQAAQTRIATESGSVYAGTQAVEFTLPQQDAELSNAVQKVLTTELDAMYLRWYSRFDADNDIVGSSHNGGGMSAHYFVGDQATPGVPADGTNKFLAEFEHWRGDTATAAPGLLNVYLYHPEQRDVYGDHFFPSGLVMPNTSLAYDFGPDFQARPELVPELGRWYCYEVLVRANTPGLRDGRITLWLDGALVADFQNLRLRDVATLKLDRFNLSFHAGSNPTGETRKYYDNVVAATSYIGPMAR